MTDPIPELEAALSAALQWFRADVHETRTGTLPTWISDAEKALTSLATLRREIEQCRRIMPLVERMIEARAVATQDGDWQTRFIWRLFDVARHDPGTLMDGDSNQDWRDSEFIATAANTVTEIANIMKETQP